MTSKGRFFLDAALEEATSAKPLEHSAKPPMPYVNFFFLDVVSKEANNTVGPPMPHTDCFLVFFLDMASKSQQSRRLIDFVFVFWRGGEAVGGGNMGMPLEFIAKKTAMPQVDAFLDVALKRSTMPQVDCYL